MRTWIASVIATAAMAAMAACDGGAPAVCTYPSGRTCPSGESCLAQKGSECNYDYCEPDTLTMVNGGVACAPGNVPPVAGGPFECDPAVLGSFGTPPPSPCPLGSLWALDASSLIPFLQCVPLDQCLPIACDPAFGGDGCPGAYRCDAGSRTCVP